MLYLSIITLASFEVGQHNHQRGLAAAVPKNFLQVPVEFLLQSVAQRVAWSVTQMSANGPLPASTKSSFATNGSSRHSPPPLAPLLYLQTHRRGSITDPSLHAAPMNSSITLNTNYRQPLDQPGSASSGPSSARHDSSPKNHLSDPRPASPYVFGDATPHLADNSPQIRNLLRSPSVERNHNRSSSALSHEGSQVFADNSSGRQDTSLFLREHSLI